MIRPGHRTVLLSEVVEKLSIPGVQGLKCRVYVDYDHEVMTVTLTMSRLGQDLFETAELLQEMDYLEGLGTVRAFAETYGLDVAAILKKEMKK